MGWFNHFYEGVSSVVHSIATTAKMVGDVATTIGTVASKIAPQSAHEDILAINDGPTIEVLSSNVEVVSAAIQAAADAELAAIHPGQPADFKVAKSYRIKGFTMNRKILSLKEAEDRKGNPSTNATPFMYGDMTNLLAQKGLPISGMYNGQKLDNAQLALNLLYLNDVEVNVTRSLRTYSTKAICLLTTCRVFLFCLLPRVGPKPSRHRESSPATQQRRFGHCHSFDGSRRSVAWLQKCSQSRDPNCRHHARPNHGYPRIGSTPRMEDHVFDAERGRCHPYHRDQRSAY